MNTTDLRLGSRPMTARQLTDRAKEFDWNPRIPFKYWARAAETIHHEVCPPSQHPNTLGRRIRLTC
jgi:STAM-binding protein